MKQRLGLKFVFWIFLILPFFTGAQVDHWETVIFANDEWEYLVPASEPDPNWKEVGFDASSWEKGIGGIGYGDGDDGTIIDRAVSVYIRHEFDIVDITKILRVLLSADYDDGFVAYINGVEISRAFMTGNPPAFDALSNELHEALLYQGIPPEPYIVENDVLEGLLNNGKNVLAVQVHNYDGLLSSDLSSNFYLNLGISDGSRNYRPYPSWFVPPIEPTPPFQTPLPIIRINTFGQLIFPDPAIPGVMEVVWNGEGNLNSSDGPANELSVNMEIDKRGQSSLSFPKNGYAIETKDEFGEDMNVSFLGFPEDEDWILHGPYSDKTLMRNVLAMHIGNKVGGYHSRTRFVELIVNDSYEGIYVMMERIKRGPDRVDIARLRTEDIAGDELTGGYIFKIDKDVPDWYSQFDMVLNAPFKVGFQHVYPRRAIIQPQQADYIKSYVDSMENALFAPSLTFAGKSYLNFIDLQSFAEHFLMKELAKEVDAYRISSYYFKRKNTNGGKVYAGPVWDFNLGYGNADYCEGWSTTGWMYSLNCDRGNPFWWNRLRGIDEFNNILSCRWEELKEGPLSVDSIFNFIDEKVAELEPALERNFKRWPVLDVYVWPNSGVRNTFENEITFLKDFYMQRVGWMSSQLNNSCIVSTEEEDYNTFFAKAFPNPLGLEDLQLNFEAEANSQIQLTIYDAVGKLVFEKSIFSNEDGIHNLTVPSSVFASGLYICGIRVGNEFRSLKIIK